MGRTTADAIIPTRFITTLAHFMATIMVYLTKDGNIRAALPLRDLSNYNSFDTSLTTALSLTWVCFAVEFSGLFLGLTMFKNSTNVFYSIAHVLATICLSFYMVEAWHFAAYWYIFGFCSALPALLECWHVFRVLVLKLD